MSGGFEPGAKDGHGASVTSATTAVGPGKSTRTAPALPRTTVEVVGPRAGYADLLTAVITAKGLTDHLAPDDAGARDQIVKLLEPIEQRLGQLNDHQGRLAQFGAGSVAGQVALDTSEAAIRSWRQLLLLGAMVRTDELVLRFRMGSEVIQFLTGEQRDAPTLREFNRVSGLVGVGAAAPVLGPPLVALAAEESALLAFATRVTARRVALWAVTQPTAALAASEVLLGLGLQIGEGGWEGFWSQLQDPQGWWLVAAQVLMDYMHVKGSTADHGGVAPGSRPAAPRGTEPDLEVARQRLESARRTLKQVGDAATTVEPANERGPRSAHRPGDAAGRTAEGSDFGLWSVVGAPTRDMPGAGPKRVSGSKPYLDNPFGHVEQREPDWCGAACGEMSARRLGVEVDQAAIVATPHFVPTEMTTDGKQIPGGFQTQGLADALREVAPIPGRVWVGGEIAQDISTPSGLRTHLAGYLASTKASIILRVTGGKHWIVIDAVLPDGTIVVRDPGAKQSTILSGAQLSARRPTGSAVFSFPEKKQ